MPLFQASATRRSIIRSSSTSSTLRGSGTLCTVQSGIEINKSYFCQMLIYPSPLAWCFGVAYHARSPFEVCKVETLAHRVQFVRHEACAYNIRDGSGRCFG
jgi:hypothetical protein